MPRCCRDAGPQTSRTQPAWISGQLRKSSQSKPLRAFSSATGTFSAILTARVAVGSVSWQVELMPTAPIAPYDESVTHQLARADPRGEPHAGPSDGSTSSPAPSCVVIIATAVMQVRLNAWNQPFYDAIERRDLDEFLRQLGVFFVIAGILLVLNVAQTGFNQLIRVKLRELATTGPDRQLDDAQARGADQPRRRDRRQSRPAHPGGRAEPDRAHHRPRHRPRAVLDPARRASSACSGSSRRAW